MPMPPQHTQHAAGCGQLSAARAQPRLSIIHTALPDDNQGSRGPGCCSRTVPGRGPESLPTQCTPPRGSWRWQRSAWRWARRRRGAPGTLPPPPPRRQRPAPTAPRARPTALMLWKIST